MLYIPTAMKTHRIFNSIFLLALFIFLIRGISANDGSNTENAARFSKEEMNIKSYMAIIQNNLYSNPDTARLVAEEALALAIYNNDEYHQTVMLNALGVSYLIQANYGRASDYLFRSLRVANKLGNKARIARTYNNLGILNRELGNIKEALSYYLKAIDYYDETGDESNTANVLNNISVLYSELKNKNKALEYNIKAFDAFNKLNDSVGMQGILSGRGQIYLGAGKPDSAMYFLNRSAELAIKINNNYGLSNTYRHLANLHSFHGNHNQSVHYFILSKDLAQKINVMNNEAYAELGLASAYLKIGDTQRALIHGLRAIEIAEIMENKKILGSAYYQMSEVYDQMGNFKNAHLYFRKSVELKEELMDQNSLHQIYNFEIEKLNEDMKIAQLEVQRQELVLSKRNSAIVIITLAFLITIVTIVLIFSKIRQRQKAKMNEAALKHTQERSKAALAAEVMERQRLGIELHDGVGPLLSLAKLNVTALMEKPSLKSERKSMILKNTVETLNEVLKEMKHISHNMAPIVLIEKGFESAVKDLVIKLNETEKYNVILDVSGLNGTMDSYLEHAMYRSMLEIINNILMHANGSEINIQIVQDNAEITIMIEDNGKGFDLNQNKNSNGLGLKSTFSRIEGMNGKIYIDSVIGRGTIVTMVVPVYEKSKSWKE